MGPGVAHRFELVPPALEEGLQEAGVVVLDEA